MPTTTPLTDAINALTQYANETTGASDTTLSDAVGTLVAGYGGGGGGISLLETITVTTDTRAVDIDMTPYVDYDIVIILFDTLTIPSGDWLYTVRNGSSPSGGVYTASQSLFKGVHIIIAELAGSINSGKTKREIFETSNGAQVYAATEPALTNYYLYTYSASRHIAAGSVIKIYGANYANL